MLHDWQLEPLNAVPSGHTHSPRTRLMRGSTQDKQLLLLAGLLHVLHVWWQYLHIPLSSLMVPVAHSQYPLTSRWLYPLHDVQNPIRYGFTHVSQLL